MRLSLLCASAALVTGLALSACSSGMSSSSAVPSSGTQTQMVGRSQNHQYTVRLAPGVRPMTIGCDYSEYSFCFYVTPGNPGPYVETSAGSGYELYNNAWIAKAKNKKGKADKKFSTYFYPDPGNPTYQYISYTGKNPTKTTKIKYTDYYCIGFSTSACPAGTYTLKLGIAVQPGT